MSLAVVYTRAEDGVQAPLVTVEVHLSGGLPGLAIVGLPEAEVRESRDRVRAALINSAFEVPQQRITVNLAPADLPKEGGRFDLPIAIGVLAASRQLPPEALAQPLWAMCEGVLMYLAPAQVRQVLQEFADHAPPGSRLVLDAIAHCGVGQAGWHASVGRTGAQFHWGIGCLSELTRMHPRLRLHLPPEQPLRRQLRHPRPSRR